MPKPGAKKVKVRNANVPETIFVSVYDNCLTAHRTLDGAENSGCAYLTEKYILSRAAPPSASEEGRLKEAVVKAAMSDYELMHDKLLECVLRTPVTSRHYEPIKMACCRLELHRRSTRAKAGGKGER